MPLLIMKEQLYLVLKVRKHLHLIIHTYPLKSNRILDYRMYIDMLAVIVWL